MPQRRERTRDRRGQQHVRNRGVGGGEDSRAPNESSSVDRQAAVPPVWASVGLRRNQQSRPMTIEFAAFSTRSEQHSASEENRKVGVKPHRSLAPWRIFDAPSNSPARIAVAYASSNARSV